VQQTRIILLTWFLSFLSSGVPLFAAGDSTADTSVPWVILAPDSAAKPARPVTRVSPKDAAQAKQITDTVAAVPIGQSTRRDSLLDSILSTIDSGERHSPIPATRAKNGIPERLSSRVKSGVRAASSEGAMLFERHRTIAFVVAGACVLILLCWIVLNRRRAQKDEKRFMTTTRLSLMNGEVQRACLHIEKKYMDPSLTPASVCRYIITGQPFLETMFERELGMSIAAYIDQVRIHHARQIVQWNPEAEAAFVAEHTGYANAAEFVKEWRRVTGDDFYDYRSAQNRPSGGDA
jgi:AraC-like DNA-binding protein